MLPRSHSFLGGHHRLWRTSVGRGSLGAVACAIDPGSGMANCFSDMSREGGGEDALGAGIRPRHQHVLRQSLLLETAEPVGLGTACETKAESYGI